VQLFEEAIDAWKAVGRERAPLFAVALANLATAMEKASRFTESVEVGRRALVMTRETKGDNPSLKRAYYNVAARLFRLRRFDEARPLARLALDNYRRHADLAGPAQTERQMLSLAAALRRALDLYVSLPEDGRSVYEDVLPAKGAVLRDHARRRALLRTLHEEGRPQVREPIERLGQQTQRLAALALGPHTPARRDAMAVLVRERDEAEARLAAVSGHPESGRGVAIDRPAL
jgi:tetratricopeptide (TPR) repeat protein